MIVWIVTLKVLPMYRLNSSIIVVNLCNINEFLAWNVLHMYMYDIIKYVLCELHY